MFFKNYFNGLAETLDIKYRSNLRDGMNSADIGELCEIFIKEFLNDCLSDQYKVHRGGNIVNSNGDRSTQLDVILTQKNSLKLFGDKGIYPIETVSGVFSVTSNLTKSKLKNCVAELGKIPKHHYNFTIENYFGSKHIEDTKKVWKLLMPFSCIFAFKGKLAEDWVIEMEKELAKILDRSLWPTMIVVNKVGILYKDIWKVGEEDYGMKYSFISFKQRNNYGEAFSRILYALYNQSGEQHYLMPEYKHYFNEDIEHQFE